MLGPQDLILSTVPPPGNVESSWVPVLCGVLVLGVWVPCWAPGSWAGVVVSLLAGLHRRLSSAVSLDLFNLMSWVNLGVPPVLTLLQVPVGGSL